MVRNGDYVYLATSGRFSFDNVHNELRLKTAFFSGLGGGTDIGIKPEPKV